MTGWDNIKTMTFSILIVCFVFYLFMGIYSYRKDNKSKVNVNFFILCLCASIWAIGYAFMLISPNIEIANSWRIVSALGWCFFNGLWLVFVFSLGDTDQKKSSFKIQYLLYFISMLFFISNLMFGPLEVVSSKAYGFIDNLYTLTTIGMVFTIYNIVIFTASLGVIYFKMRNAQKNRVRKQMKTILITSLISVCLALITDLILPPMGITVFPSGIITLSIGMGGMWYAINKYKMMSISYELVSEYIFEAVNEPILILDEDFLVKNCNEAALNITGYNYKNLEQKPLEAMIDFKGHHHFSTIMQVENVAKIEVDLQRKNKETLVCELAATVIYDVYKDILGILVLLHDVSERKKMAEIQKNYTLKLEETNVRLRNEITDRLLAEDQIRHLIYYDALTELSNRKKMLEDMEILLDNKNEKFAILFIDLDHFKNVNDDYGHEAGDEVLKIAAVRLKKIIKPMDTINRIGGDEFIIILRNLTTAGNAEEFAVAVGKTLSTPFIYKKHQLFISASVGISIFPEHGMNADRLINKADFAMYEVKRKGGNGYETYSTEIKENDTGQNLIPPLVNVPISGI